MVKSMKGLTENTEMIKCRTYESRYTVHNVHCMEFSIYMKLYVFLTFEVCVFCTGLINASLVMIADKTAKIFICLLEFSISMCDIYAIFM